ncbi:hypothetical protein HanIR_Chr04g0151731 [Helianthus annuus]|nr:hypothetical protein HanIR_Chr04g0151731 [Helianthus annuus]
MFRRVGTGDSGSQLKSPSCILIQACEFSGSWFLSILVSLSSSSTKKELIRSKDTLTWINAESASGKNLTGSDMVLNAANIVKIVAASKGALFSNTHPKKTTEETSVGDIQYKTVP